MGDHDRIVDLDKWKKKKEEEEIEALHAKVSVLIDQYFGEEELTGYYPALSEMDSSGLYVSNTINVEPTAQSCASALAWISYTLVGLGMVDEACVLDSLVERIETKL